MKAEEQIRKLNERAVSSTEEKKQKLKISIILFSVTTISVCFLIFAFYQKNEAVNQMLRAEKYLELAKVAKFEAEKQTKLAQEQKKLAEENALIAAKNAEEAKRVLEECESKRKK